MIAKDDKCHLILNSPEEFEFLFLEEAIKDNSKLSYKKPSQTMGIRV